MKARTIIKVIVGVVVIGGGMTYFMFQAMQSSMSYYYSVDEFISGSEDVRTHSLRLAGKVKVGSISRDLEKMKLGFTLTGEKNEIPVTFGGTVPENFTDDIEVVIRGQLDATGTFKADSLMTKCESKYKAKVN